jgi:hypothetical protein
MIIMKGEVPQPGGSEAVRAETRARPFAENERKLACRKAFYETFLGQDTISSPEELPASLYLPAQALGDIQRAIQQTYEKGREYSQFTRWDPQRGFTPSKLFKGREDETSKWEFLHHKWHDDARSSDLVALHYHTHPDNANHTHTLQFITSDTLGDTTYGLFSNADVAHALYNNTPIHLVAMHQGIYGLVQTDLVARSSLQEEVRQRFQSGYSQAYMSIAESVRELEDIGLGLYRWEIPHAKPLSYLFSTNWMRFFIDKAPEARDMRTRGITMTKLVPQPVLTSSPVPETRVFGQI